MLSLSLVSLSGLTLFVSTSCQGVVSPDVGHCPSVLSAKKRFTFQMDSEIAILCCTLER
jgi:hypothetical protein